MYKTTYENQVRKNAIIDIVFFIIFFFLFHQSGLAKTFPIKNKNNVCEFIDPETEYKWHVVNGEWAVAVTIESYGGQANNTATDNGPALTNALIDANASSLSLFEIVLTAGATYNFDTTAYAGANADNTDGLVIRSSISNQKAFLRTDNLTNLLSHAYQEISNWELRDLSFEGTIVDAASFNEDRNGDALVYMSFTEGVNHRWIRCSFTNPDSRNNAMKYYIDVNQQGGVDRTIVDGIYFEECDFINVGRFSLEILGLPANFRNGTYTLAKNEFAIRNIHIKDCNFDYNEAGFAISLIDSIEGVLIEGNTINDSDCALEISVENAEIRNNIISGSKGSNFTFGGDYEGQVGTDVTINWGGNDYDIHDNNFNAVGGSDAVIGSYNINFTNNIYNSWGVFLTKGTDLNFTRNDMTFVTANRVFRQQDAGSFGNLILNNNLITIQNDVNIASVQTGLNFEMYRNDIYVVNTANFPVEVDVNVDNRKFVNGVQTQDYGWTNTDRGIIGYVENSTPPVTPPNTGITRAKVYRKYFNFY